MLPFCFVRQGRKIVFSFVHGKFLLRWRWIRYIVVHIYTKTAENSDSVSLAVKGGATEKIARKNNKREGKKDETKENGSSSQYEKKA